MGQFDARRPGASSHGGTFNGNPVAAVAGLATLEQLTDDVYAALDRSGRRLGAAVENEIRRLGVDAGIVTAGSLFQLVSGETESAVATGLDRAPDLFLGLLLEGFLVAPRGMGAIAAVATDDDVDDLAAAIGRVLAPGRRPRADARLTRLTSARRRRRPQARRAGRRCAGRGTPATRARRSRSSRPHPRRRRERRR